MTQQPNRTRCFEGECHPLNRGIVIRPVGRASGTASWNSYSSAAQKCALKLAARIDRRLSGDRATGSAITMPAAIPNADQGLTSPHRSDELHHHKGLEVAERIALPMICSAGRRLAVLATPPQNWERAGELHQCISRESALANTESGSRNLTRASIPLSKTAISNFLRDEDIAHVPRNKTPIG